MHLQSLVFQIVQSGFNPDVVIAWRIQMTALLTAVTLHEVAHGYAALRMGDPTARDAGRLTFNPIAHFDIFGALMILIGAPIAWAKPVPVNPTRFDRGRSYKRSIMIVSIAGIVTNIITAFLAYFLVRILILTLGSVSTQALGTAVGILTLYFQRLALISVFLAVFNLLPVPPLDGFKFFGQFMSARLYNTLLRYQRQIGLAFLLMIIFGGGVFSRVLNTLATPILWLIQTPINWLFSFF